MNTFKVTLAFLELALALKFLSVADLAYGWHILDREVFVSLWIVIFSLLGCYLLGLISFPHADEDHRKTSVSRLFIAIISLAFAMYMVPGLWGAPLRAISAFAPPMTTQDWVITPGAAPSTPTISASGEYKTMTNHGGQITFTDYEEGIAYAKENKKMRQVLSEAESALKFARDKLIEKEEENRQLKLIILRMTERGDKDAS